MYIKRPVFSFLFHGVLNVALCLFFVFTVDQITLQVGNMFFHSNNLEYGKEVSVRDNFSRLQEI